MKKNGGSHNQNHENKHGEMILVCSAKGGVGKTFISVNLAVALAKHRKVILMDADFQFGDVCLAMDLSPLPSIRDLVGGVESLEQDRIDDYLNSHDSGVFVMAAPELPEYADLITSPLVNKVCSLLLQRSDYVIVDTGTGFQDNSLQLFEQADHIYMITELEMPALKNTKLMLKTLQKLDLLDKTQVIVNRASREKRDVLPLSHVSDIIGSKTPICLSEQISFVSESLNVGIPFVRKYAKTELAKEIEEMVEQLITNGNATVLSKKSTHLQTVFSKISNRFRRRSNHESV